MKKTTVIIFMLLVLTGCAYEKTYDFKGPIESYRGSQYVQANWASVSLPEAFERCRGEVQSGRFPSHYICMKSNGYEKY